MPAKSKSQQRLFGWALACKKDSSNSCPPSVKKLVDSMSEEELEKYAKTSNEDLPNKIKESLDEIISIYVELVEAEIGEDLETYEYEVSEETIIDDDFSDDEVDDDDEVVSESKSPKIGQPAGKDLPKAKAPVGDKKLPDAKSEKTPANREIADAKDEVEDKKNEIPVPKGKAVAAAKPDVSAAPNVEKKDPPASDNEKDEKDESWDKPNPGMEKAGKSVMGNIYTPSLHKFPMSTNSKNERRIYDFQGFLEIINYKTHANTLQDSHGKNSGDSASTPA